MVTKILTHVCFSVIKTKKVLATFPLVWALYQEITKVANYRNWLFLIKIMIDHRKIDSKNCFYHYSTSYYCSNAVHKQPSIDVFIKKCPENMQRFYRRTPIRKYDFNKVARQLYWDHTSAWVFSCKLAANFQDNFLQEHLWETA